MSATTTDNRGRTLIGEMKMARKITHPVTGQVVEVNEAQDQAAYRWAKNEQGYTGTYAEWQAMGDDERNEYEQGAAGIPTG